MNAFQAMLKNLIIHMKHWVLEVHPFVFFLNEFDMTKGHNMLAFMLDSIFKDMQLVTNYVR
jgi:hypothetical protein